MKRLVVAIHSGWGLGCFILTSWSRILMVVFILSSPFEGLIEHQASWLGLATCRLRHCLSVQPRLEIIQDPIGLPAPNSSADQFGHHHL